MLKVLVACEESQRVCSAFRRLGHEAYSCDIIEPSGGHPEWHIKGDVLEVLNPKDHLGGFEAPDQYISFKTMDGSYHEVEKWDLIVAFPPCTHLAVSGARHFEKKRADGRQREGIELFCKILNADCDKICVENPVNIISGDYVKRWFPELCEEYGLPISPTQTIQPYEYGHPSRKKTCLWLKGLPTLVPTKIVEPKIKEYICKNGKIARFSDDYGSGDKTAGTRRSKTYEGIAEAMAEQWSAYLTT
jgi:hypothetical protein